MRHRRFLRSWLRTPCCMHCKASHILFVATRVMPATAAVGSSVAAAKAQRGMTTGLACTRSPVMPQPQCLSLSACPVSKLGLIVGELLRAQGRATGRQGDMHACWLCRPRPAQPAAPATVHGQRLGLAGLASSAIVLQVGWAGRLLASDPQAARIRACFPLASCLQAPSPTAGCNHRTFFRRM